MHVAGSLCPAKHLKAQYLQLEAKVGLEVHVGQTSIHFQLNRLRLAVGQLSMVPLLLQALHTYSSC
jgi:hypothetical protein